MELSEIKNRKVYISGKMTGLSIDEIFKNFNHVEDVLVSNQNYVMNPAIMWHLKDTTGFTAEQYLAIDFAMMEACDTIIVLPNWETSSGAKEEIKNAIVTNMTIYFLKENDVLEEKHFTCEDLGNF